MTGWKEWGIGEVVEAGDFQTYVQDQTVQNYATSAARGSALGTAVAEGMVSYLQDSNSVQVYDGSAWQAIAPVSHNYIINGAFDINQRGFTTTSTADEYLFDRWNYSPSGGTGTATASTFTPGTAPVAGYEGKNYINLDVTTGNDYFKIQHRIEGVRTLAGQTATLSFWAKGTNPATAGNLAVEFRQQFGTGGSPSSTVIVPEQTFVLTANWTRYSFVFSIPSIAGKTIGTANNDYLELFIGQGTSTSTDAWELDIWGVQLEAGSIATPFKRHAPSLQGELAACQRYFERLGAASSESGAPICFGFATSTTVAKFKTNGLVKKRTVPTITFKNNTDFRVWDGVGAAPTTTAMAVTAASNDFSSNSEITATVSSGLTQYRPVTLIPANLVEAYIDISAEL